jgi:hypothetical protein
MKEAVQTKDDILRAIRANRDRIRALGVRRLGLFGSFVRGEQRATSDVDFLAEFEAGEKTFDHFMGLCLLLEDLLSRRVEVVTRESLSVHIGPHILGEVEYVPIAA